MIHKLMAALLSALLLTGFDIIVFPDRLFSGESFIQTAFLFFLVVVISHLAFSLPFTLVIDMFVMRITSLRPLFKHGLRILLFVGSSFAMSAYIVLLTQIKDGALISRLLSLMIVGAVLFLAAEYVLRRKSKKQQT